MIFFGLTADVQAQGQQMAEEKGRVGAAGMTGVFSRETL